MKIFEVGGQKIWESFLNASFYNVYVLVSFVSSSNSLVSLVVLIIYIYIYKSYAICIFKNKLRLKLNLFTL